MVAPMDNHQPEEADNWGMASQLCYRNCYNSSMVRSVEVNLLHTSCEHCYADVVDIGDRLSWAVFEGIA